MIPWSSSCSLWSCLLVAGKSWGQNPVPQQKLSRTSVPEQGTFVQCIPSDSRLDFHLLKCVETCLALSKHYVSFQYMFVE